MLRNVTSAKASPIYLDLLQMSSPDDQFFAVWGIDLIGSLPTGKGGIKYAIVAVDYFTQWVKAEPLATITSKKTLDFVIKNIVCRYRLLRKIVSDNGLEFDNEVFTDFCQRHGVLKSFSSVAHLQENGQVEAVNKMLKASLKKMLEQAKGAWPMELPRALWSYHITARTSTGHSLFSMAYGYKAMLSVEAAISTHRWDTYDPTTNLALLRESLDLVEELCEASQLRVSSYQQKVA
ncbi:uncharacterized protein LOC133832804 [Humulus lupulus]|uniref:uncharacterized protein LOC133832804 n=1 Tax=Humulus lupulus TaxID=3486 RepID=UPI002B4058AE|nr:uncharacterized protein LOC133832804 [Humulus lupulus]